MCGTFFSGTCASSVLSCLPLPLRPVSPFLQPSSFLPLPCPNLTTRALLQSPARAFPEMKSLPFLRMGNMFIYLELLSSEIHLCESLQDWKVGPDGHVPPSTSLMSTESPSALTSLHSLSACHVPDVVLLPFVSSSDGELTTSQHSPTSPSQETHH